MNFKASLNEQDVADHVFYSREGCIVFGSCSCFISVGCWDAFVSIYIQSMMVYFNTLMSNLLECIYSVYRVHAQFTLSFIFLYFLMFYHMNNHFVIFFFTIPFVAVLQQISPQWD